MKSQHCLNPAVPNLRVAPAAVVLHFLRSYRNTKVEHHIV